MFVETPNMFSFVDIIFIKSNSLVDYKLQNMTLNYKHMDMMLQFPILYPIKSSKTKVFEWQDHSNPFHLIQTAFEVIEGKCDSHKQKLG